MREDRIKHLELIQAVITRMASNSFLIKGWTITVIGGLYALWLSQQVYYILVLILFMSIFFWMHDAYFLKQERDFRKLYDIVREETSKKVDFRMTAKNDETFVAAAFRPILFWSYGPLVVTTLGLLCIFK